MGFFFVSFVSFCSKMGLHPSLEQKETKVTKQLIPFLVRQPNNRLLNWLRGLRGLCGLKHLCWDPLRGETPLVPDAPEPLVVSLDFMARECDIL
jgi:hypothetical protein